MLRKQPKYTLGMFNKYSDYQSIQVNNANYKELDFLTKSKHFQPATSINNSLGFIDASSAKSVTIPSYNVAVGHNRSIQFFRPSKIEPFTYDLTNFHLKDKSDPYTEKEVYAISNRQKNLDELRMSINSAPVLSAPSAPVLSAPSAPVFRNRTSEEMSDLTETEFEIPIKPVINLKKTKEAVEQKQSAVSESPKSPKSLKQKFKERADRRPVFTTPKRVTISAPSLSPSSGDYKTPFGKASLDLSDDQFHTSSGLLIKSTAFRQASDIEDSDPEPLSVKKGGHQHSSNFNRNSESEPEEPKQTVELTAKIEEFKKGVMNAVELLKQGKISSWAELDRQAGLDINSKRPPTFLKGKDLEHLHREHALAKDLLEANKRAKREARKSPKTEADAPASASESDAPAPNSREAKRYSKHKKQQMDDEQFRREQIDPDFPNAIRFRKTKTIATPIVPPELFYEL